MKSMLHSAVIVIVAACAFAVPVSAATPVGENLAQQPIVANSDYTITRQLNQDATDYAGSSVAGVLVSLSVRTTGDAGNGVIRILRPNGHPAIFDFSYINAVGDIPFSVVSDGSPSGHITSFPTRERIRVADHLGLSMTSNAGVTSTVAFANANASGGSGECSFTGPNHLIGVSIDYSTVGCNNFVPLVQGIVEPDADGDGYGDESQDACPAEAARQSSPCTADVGVFARSARKVGRDGTRKRVRFEVLNHGPSTAFGITLRITKPSFVGALTASGCTLSLDRRTCTIASLPNGLNTFVVISVRSKRARVRSSKRRNLSLRLVGLGETDPDATNNDALYALKLRMRKR